MHNTHIGSDTFPKRQCAWRFLSRIEFLICGIHVYGIHAKRKRNKEQYSCSLTIELYAYFHKKIKLLLFIFIFFVPSREWETRRIVSKIDTRIEANLEKHDVTRCIPVSPYRIRRIGIVSCNDGNHDCMAREHVSSVVHKRHATVRMFLMCRFNDTLCGKMYGCQTGVYEM